MKPISKMDWDIIEARVAKACDQHQFQTKTVGFLAIVIDQVFPGHEDQLKEITADGPLINAMMLASLSRHLPSILNRAVPPIVVSA
ncbi:hypothetical protein [Pyruvatibacter mobilis]|uniref:hypothetical protein n=1 Tax=Pyruvatibacter mobilis TaxID=1712261 RepID=UPI003BA8715C